jgi:hypothetical protein
MTELSPDDKTIGNGFVARPSCAECNKEIWGLSKAFETIGIEKPVYLHYQCFWDLKESIYVKYVKDG